MSEIDDGVIKYQRDFTKTEALKPDQYRPLECWRKKLYQLKLIGEYPSEKIGYGNLSMRLHEHHFLITGTQTGKHPDLNGEHYTIVTGHDLKMNLIKASGPIDASSEALTHAAIYAHNQKIQAVFHVHEKLLWNAMLEHNLAHTQKDIPYGTVAMATAVNELIADDTCGVFAMAGHEDGIVSFGKNLDEAGELILELVKRFKN